MAQIKYQDTDGTKGVLPAGNLGYDAYTAGGDEGRVYVGDGTSNIALAKKSEVDAAQPVDAGLTSISGLTTAADNMIYTTALDTYAVAVLTTAGRALLDDIDTATQRTTLGLAIGTDVMAYDATMVVDADIGVTVQGYDADTAKTDVVQAFTASQSGTVVVANDGVINLALGNNFSVTPTAAVTIANPTNIVAGQAGDMFVDATTYVISFGTVYKFAGGTAPTLSGNCILSYYVKSATEIIVSEVSAYA